MWQRGRAWQWEGEERTNRGIRETVEIDLPALGKRPDRGEKSELTGLLDPSVWESRGASGMEGVTWETQAIPKCVYLLRFSLAVCLPYPYDPFSLIFRSCTKCDCHC